MRLSVRVVQEQDGRPRLALCDGAGAPLPGQRGLVFDQPYGEAQTVTVTFVVGRDVVLGDPARD